MWFLLQTLVAMGIATVMIYAGERDGRVIFMGAYSAAWLFTVIVNFIGLGLAKLRVWLASRVGSAMPPAVPPSVVLEGQLRRVLANMERELLSSPPRSLPDLR